MTNFEDFDFDHNADYQMWFKTKLDPKPSTPDGIFKSKLKFQKRFIDPSFDSSSYTPSSSSYTPQPNNTSNTSSKPKDDFQSNNTNYNNNTNTRPTNPKPKPQNTQTQNKPNTSTNSENKSIWQKFKEYKKFQQIFNSTAQFLQLQTSIITGISVYETMMSLQTSGTVLNQQRHILQFCCAMAMNMLCQITMALDHMGLMERVKFICSSQGLGQLIKHTDIFGHLSTVGCFYFVGSNQFILIPYIFSVAVVRTCLFTRLVLEQTIGKENSWWTMTNWVLIKQEWQVQQYSIKFRVVLFFLLAANAIVEIFMMNFNSLISFQIQGMIFKNSQQMNEQIKKDFDQIIYDIDALVGKDMIVWHQIKLGFGQLGKQPAAPAKTE